MAEYELGMSVTEICLETNLEEVDCLEIVECGIVAPAGNEPRDWRFDESMLGTMTKAVRLQKELHLEWSAVALIINLIEEREQLQTENEILRRQLQRFL